MENELIEIVFDPAEENINWEKRKPRNTQKISKVSKQEHTIKQVTNQYKTAVCSEMNEGFSKSIADVDTCINENTKEVITEKINGNTQKGQTKRGIEIQEELANLRDEIKRKDLNPIEKENLTNALLKLQNEINSDFEKFSKFDSIPVRLNQIENYLEKLKDKEDIKQQLINLKNEPPKETKTESPKKQKRQVIWKFGI